MSGLLDAVGPFAPLLVFVLATAESAAFVGVVAPGELAVILGGVAAGTGRTPLWLTAVAAVAGAIIGDSIGYRLGRVMGASLSARPRMHRVAAQLDRAARLVAERGWWALVIARFASVLRAVVPFAAGMGRMRYRTFLLGNAIGGTLWAVTFTLVGYLAGANYQRVERWMRTGGLAVVALAVIIGAIVWATRWVEDHREAVGGRLQKVAEWWPVRPLLGGLRRTNRSAATLLLTATAAVGGLWLFAALAQDVVGAEEFFFFDAAAIRYLDTRRVAPLIDAARLVNGLTWWPWIVLAVAAIVVVAVRRRRLRVLPAVAVALGGQWLIVQLTQHLVHRLPPAATPIVARAGYGFPSHRVAWAAAVACLAAWPWYRQAWRRTVAWFGAAAVALTLAGASRVVLLIEYPSDTIAAGGVAAAWTLLVCIAFDPLNPTKTADTAPASP